MFAGAAALSALAVVAAQAQTIYIGYGPAGSVTTVSSGSTIVTGTGGLGAPFATTATDFTGTDLSGLTVTDSSSVTGAFTVWVSEVDIPHPSNQAYKLEFTSGFTQNLLPPSGATVIETTWFDQSPGGTTPYVTTTKLGTATFSSNGTTSVVYGPTNVTGPYSLTEEFYINTSATTPDPLSTILITTKNLGPAPVPEASTWAMMGVGFAGLAFAGYTGRRKARAFVA